MQALRISLVIAILCFVLIANLVLFINAQLTPPTARGNASEGAPFFFVDASEYWCEISDYIVCGNYLYVLYDSKCVLACYDLNGMYRHSYGLSMSQNGQAHLYVNDNILYLESREHSFYTFEDGKFIDFTKVDVEQLYSFREKLTMSQNARQSQDGAEYELRGTSIWRTQGMESSKVVHRAGWLIIFKGCIQLGIFIGSMLLLLLMWKRVKIR